jgi:hypothetical protein
MAAPRRSGVIAFGLVLRLRGGLATRAQVTGRRTRATGMLACCAGKRFWPHRSTATRFRAIGANLVCQCPPKAVFHVGRPSESLVQVRGITGPLVEQGSL